MTDNSAVPSLYEWLGKADVLRKLTTRFYERVLADDLLLPLFAGMPQDHPRHVADFVGEVMGGAPDYTATRGGHHIMLGQHFGRNISEEQRRRWVNLLLDTADEVVCPTIRNSARRSSPISNGDHAWRSSTPNSRRRPGPIRQRPCRAGTGASPAVPTSRRRTSENREKAGDGRSPIL